MTVLSIDILRAVWKLIYALTYGYLPYTLLLLGVISIIRTKGKTWYYMLTAFLINILCLVVWDEYIYMDLLLGEPINNAPIDPAFDCSMYNFLHGTEGLIPWQFILLAAEIVLLVFFVRSFRSLRRNGSRN